MADNYTRVKDDNKPTSTQEMKTLYTQKRDNFLDQAIKTTDETTKLSKQINKQIATQGQELDNLNDRLDKVNTQMGGVVNRMEDFLKNTSNNCLYMAIAISGFLFLLLVSI